MLFGTTFMIIPNGKRLAHKLGEVFIYYLLFCSARHMFLLTLTLSKKRQSVTKIQWVGLFLNRRCCCNETPPTLNKKFFSYPHDTQKISKVVYRKTLSCNREFSCDVTWSQFCKSSYLRLPLSMARFRKMQQSVPLLFYLIHTTIPDYNRVARIYRAMQKETKRQGIIVCV